MIYDQIDETVKTQLATLEAERVAVETSIFEKNEAIKVEDSKRREAEMKEENKGVTRKRHFLR